MHNASKTTSSGKKAPSTNIRKQLEEQSAKADENILITKHFLNALLEQEKEIKSRYLDALKNKNNLEATVRKSEAISGSQILEVDYTLGTDWAEQIKFIEARINHINSTINSTKDALRNLEVEFPWDESNLKNALQLRHNYWNAELKKATAAINEEQIKYVKNKLSEIADYYRTLHLYNELLENGETNTEKLENSLAQAKFNLNNLDQAQAFDKMLREGADAKLELENFRFEFESIEKNYKDHQAKISALHNKLDSYKDELESYNYELYSRSLRHNNKGSQIKGENLPLSRATILYKDKDGKIDESKLESPDDLSTINPIRRATDVKNITYKTKETDKDGKESTKTYIFENVKVEQDKSTGAYTTGADNNSELRRYETHIESNKSSKDLSEDEKKSTKKLKKDLYPVQTSVLDTDRVIFNPARPIQMETFLDGEYSLAPTLNPKFFVIGEDQKSKKTTDNASNLFAELKKNVKERQGITSANNNAHSRNSDISLASKSIQTIDKKVSELGLVSIITDETLKTTYKGRFDYAKKDLKAAQKAQKLAQESHDKDETNNKAIATKLEKANDAFAKAEKTFNTTEAMLNSITTAIGKAQDLVSSANKERKNRPNYDYKIKKSDRKLTVFDSINSSANKFLDNSGLFTRFVINPIKLVISIPVRLVKLIWSGFIYPFNKIFGNKSNDSKNSSNTAVKPAISVQENVKKAKESTTPEAHKRTWSEWIRGQNKPEKDSVSRGK